MSKTHSGLLIKAGKIERVEVGPYPHMRDLIGNTMTTAFRVQGHKPYFTIDGYCDDEFLLRNEPDWNVVLQGGTLYAENYPIGGPIVIIGGDERDGESRSLTQEEIESFFLIEQACWLKPLMVVLPMLGFKPKF